MATAAQITANQQNAQRSTGPKTDAGKDTCSRNAIRHGLTATKFVLSVEDEAEFNALHDAMVEAAQPATAYEHVLLDDTVRAHWMWTRAQAVHTAFLETIVDEERKANPKLSADQALARVFTEEKNAKRLRLLMRYEAAAERTYRKCLKEMEGVIGARVKMDEQKRAAERVRALRSNPIGSVSHTVSPDPLADHGPDTRVGSAEARLGATAI